jgi:hypothetical protein
MEAQGIRADSKIGSGDLEAGRIALEDSHGFLESQYANHQSVQNRELYRQSLRRMIRMHEKLAGPETTSNFQEQLGKLSVD